MFLSNSVDMMKNLQIPDKKFAKFPQPGGRNPDIKRCKQWIILMRRQNFTIENIVIRTHGCARITLKRVLILII